jgi:hypothetical protein
MCAACLLDGGDGIERLEPAIALELAAIATVRRVTRNAALIAAYKRRDLDD